MKPRVFVGSSREQLDVAKAIQQNLEPGCDVAVWDQGIFPHTTANLHGLLEIVERADFGVFVMTAEDLTLFRGRETKKVRDNVLFELGLYMGRLGNRRTFLVAPRSNDQPLDLPTDLLGVLPLPYDPAHFYGLQPALGSACTSISNAIKAEGLRTSQVDILQSQRDVMAYVLNRLNPYTDIRLSRDFLANLPIRFHRIDDVLYPLDTLIHQYVPELIQNDMRVYFAYRLPEKLTVKAGAHPAYGAEFEAHYRVGTSFSRTPDRWYEGLFIGTRSNVHRSFEMQVVSKVWDARHSHDSEAMKNERVNDEASVIALPILYGEEDSRTECIGVIGLSSPRPGEATKPAFEALAHELSTLFSALFYAYGKARQRTQSFDQVVDEMRRQIAAHYAAKFDAAGGQ